MEVKDINKNISKSCLSRLPKYLRILKEQKQENFENISATIIANELNLNSIQVRKDLALVSSVEGKPGIGFNINKLIIDDLGSEKITESKITELFTILNTRLLNQNHKITKTIISTNLTIEEIFKTYTTRIGSRLAGNYRFLRFFGDDLRFKRVKKQD